MSQLIVKRVGDQVSLSRVHPGSRAKVLGVFDTSDDALDRAEEVMLQKPRDEFVIDEIKVLKDRNCIRCTAEFASEGPHHRMCARCRSISYSGLI